MDMKRVVLCSLVGIHLTGCAGPSAFHEIRRLRADVGLLDQRVTQLERMTGQASSATAWPSEGKAQPASTAVQSTVKPIAEPAARPLAAPLGKGSKQDIQQALKNAGFYQGPIDGKIGPKTREAIKQFQQANGLKVDGKIGRHTWQKLAPYLNVAAGSEQPATVQPSK